jgi:ammonium transporter, Amt family
VLCFFTATRLKQKLRYDDSLDVFGVHAVAGMFGALLTGPLASATLGGFGDVSSLGGQLWIQAKGVAFTVVWSTLFTLVILKLIDWTLGLRVTEEQEQIGLDLALHEEKAYNLSN